MPSPPRFDNPDAKKNEEIAAADQACDRLVEYLRRLDEAMGNVAQQTFKNRQLRLKHQAAAQALQGHAQTILEKFAFIDGERVDHPHGDLLTVFYLAPKDSVASRYCWALLCEAPAPNPPLIKLIAAALVEHEAFRRGQIDDEPSNEIGGPRDLVTLLTAHQKRADRLFYTVALLRRLLLVQRRVSGEKSAPTRELEREIVKLSDAAHVADSDLRKIRLKWVAALRAARR